jgi:hypothetical protein
MEDFERISVKSIQSVSSSEPEKTLMILKNTTDCILGQTLLNSISFSPELLRQCQRGEDREEQT